MNRQTAALIATLYSEISIVESKHIKRGDSKFKTKPSWRTTHTEKH
jgi:hypothetical protein